jgi:hypothetical protein
VIGKSLGHHRITAAIGAGGMGEAKLLASLNHPNVAQVSGAPGRGEGQTGHSD